MFLTCGGKPPPIHWGERFVFFFRTSAGGRAALATVRSVSLKFTGPVGTRCPATVPGTVICIQMDRGVFPVALVCVTLWTFAFAWIANW